ncbi:MAG: GAF domain-containing protein [Nitrosomonadales bacterium]|nr:GAF domain-containing protein [Nitrosomonadales bacterium]
MLELLRNPDSFCKMLSLTVSDLSIDEIMTSVMSELNELFGCDRCTLYVVDKGTNELYTQVAQKSSIGNFRLPIDRDRSFAGFVAVTGREIMIEDIYDDRQVKKIDKDHVFSGDMDKKTSFKTRSMISVPVKMSGETIGVLQAMNKPGGFLKKDLDAMNEFAPVLALALSHALLVKELAACKREA